MQSNPLTYGTHLLPTDGISNVYPGLAVPSDGREGQSKSTEGKSSIGRSDRRLLVALSQVSTDSIWGEAIRLTFSKNDPVDIDKLLSQLHSQGRDNMDSMRRILGDAFEIVFEQESEEWREVKGYEGYYSVSSKGRVRSEDRISVDASNVSRFRKSRILASRITPSGYEAVNLSKDNIHKKCSVHRLVADAFVPNPENLPQVNHTTGVKTDNKYYLLEWVNASGNQIHAIKTGLVKVRKGEQIYKSKLSDDKVREIKRRSNTARTSVLAKEFGISTSVICAIKYGRAWKHIL